MSEREPIPEIIDTHSTSFETELVENGKRYRRKIEPIKGARQVQETEKIVTKLTDGTIESEHDANAGDWVITGSKGEEFVFTQKKFDTLYQADDQGGFVPRERFILAMPNKTGRPISINAPWATPDKPELQHGSEQAMLVVGLGANGELTNDRYLIGDEEMLLNNYEPEESDEEKPAS